MTFLYVALAIFVYIMMGVFTLTLYNYLFENPDNKKMKLKWLFSCDEFERKRGYHEGDAGIAIFFFWYLILAIMLLRLPFFVFPKYVWRRMNNDKQDKIIKTFKRIGNIELF